MATSKTNVKTINDPEIKELQKDYAELKTVISKIQDDLKAVGNKKVADLQESGQEQLENLEGKISRNPRAAVAYAFGAGFLASLILRR